MPACITSELRELVCMPIALSASRMTTSRPASAKARATARPTTPAPITAASTRSTRSSCGYHRRSMIEEGMSAPDFTLTSHEGETVALSQFRGSPVVLYFYPKDDTPGCTKQACGIRDAWGEFERSGAVVVGVSPDSPKKHAKFREKYELPFT